MNMENEDVAAKLAQQLAGQVSALGIAVQAMLSLHPHRDEAAVRIQEGIEQVLARSLAAGFPDAYLRGVEQVRDLYLLKRPADPGQPRMG